MLQFKDTVRRSLHMDKRDLVKLTQWLENKSYLQEMYIKAIRDKELYLEQFNSCGKRSNNIKINIQ